MNTNRAAAETCADVALIVDPHSRELSGVRHHIVAASRACGLTDDESHDFVTAVNEALANAVEHSQSSTAISVTCRVEGDALVATVVDRGVGFMLGTSAAPSPTSERGRGIAIMQRCTDIFRVDSRPGVGTSIVLGRFLHSAHSAHSSRAHPTARSA